MTIQILERTKCTGCRACVVGCPDGAITFLPDKEGFLYPWIDPEKCTGCELCATVCPSLHPEKVNFNETQEGFLAVGLNSDACFNSASGGAFAIFADYMQSVLGGFVFGACMDEDFYVRHQGSQSLFEAMQGSKYVQSDTGDTYFQVRQRLREGKYVLFSGTPCQIAGLTSYLGDESEKLITIDIVCHGVTSPVAFSNYIGYLNKKLGRKITFYRFRNKTKFDKGGYVGKLTFSDGSIKLFSADLDLYYRAYLRGYLSRPSCYTCSYAQRNRISDVTIGDCNTIRNYPDFHPLEAASIVLLNTEKGQMLWEKVRDKFDFNFLNLELEQENNGQLNRPCPKPEYRDEVCVQFVSGDFWSAMSLSGLRLSAKQKLLAYVRMRVPLLIRSRISTIMRSVLNYIQM